MGRRGRGQPGAATNTTAVHTSAMPGLGGAGAGGGREGSFRCGEEPGKRIHREQSTRGDAEDKPPRGDPDAEEESGRAGPERGRPRGLCRSGLGSSAAGVGAPFHMKRMTLPGAMRTASGATSPMDANEMEGAGGEGCPHGRLSKSGGSEAG
eukprot:CAMPEP_0174907512 /NCGR_PEP_ID=MMETSP0167-20121228/61024_1 /TAXON_ID=38298 /ORGANISM="Rhodella maculata, Strain CCMP736" /LENGTH=151 /DNA_ID=CAMNT_0016151007 /DNA_START=431 /DNA_END=882 /DNA_ORIENTATION=-